MSCNKRAAGLKREFQRVTAYIIGAHHSLHEFCIFQLRSVEVLEIFTFILQTKLFNEAIVVVMNASERAVNKKLPFLLLFVTIFWIDEQDFLAALIRSR